MRITATVTEAICSTKGIADMRIMYRFFQENGIIATTDEIARTEKLLGRKPRTFDNFIKEIAVEWRGKVEKAA